jgi:hypothetical protein
LSYTAPKITATVSFRIALPAKQKAEAIRRIWNRIATEKGDNVDDDGKEVELDPSHIYRSVLEKGIDLELSSHLPAGESVPSLDDAKAWDALLDAVAAGVAKSKKK